MLHKMRRRKIHAETLTAGVGHQHGIDTSYRMILPFEGKPIQALQDRRWPLPLNQTKANAQSILRASEIAIVAKHLANQLRAQYWVRYG